MLAIPAAWRKPFPPPSLSVFVFLQVLDILTTLLGLEMGAQESSIFLRHLMSIGPLPALLIGKILAVLMVALALKYQRPRLIVVMNYWLALVVTWNLGILVHQLLFR
jgi:hypothetical protein